MRRIILGGLMAILLSIVAIGCLADDDVHMTAKQKKMLLKHDLK